MREAGLRAVAMVAAAAGVLAGLGAAWLADPGETPVVEWLQQPRPLSEFALQTDDGSFSRADLAGRWTVLLFGYTRCPDVCPTSLSQLGAARRALSPAPDVNWVFVSVDPAADAPAAVSAYARAFHPDFVGATGPSFDLRALGESLGLAFAVAGGEVAHSAAISLIGPDGALRARIRPYARGARPFADELADALADVLAAGVGDGADAASAGRYR